MLFIKQRNIVLLSYQCEFMTTDVISNVFLECLVEVNVGFNFHLANWIFAELMLIFIKSHEK